MWLYKELWLGLDGDRFILVLSLIYISCCLGGTLNSQKKVTQSQPPPLLKVKMYFLLSAAASRLRQLYPILQRCVHRASAHSHALSTQPDVIQVTPKVSLFDQKVHIRVEGLPSNAEVTLHATTHLEWRKKPVQFMSCSQYVTSGDGDLDLNRDASVGGTYTGILSSV